MQATEDSQIVTNTYMDAKIEKGKEREAKKLLQVQCFLSFQKEHL